MNGEDIRFPVPDEPPIDCTVAELRVWLDALRARDADLTRYAVTVTLRHLTGAGVSPHPELSGVTDWQGFGLYLMLTISAALDRESGKPTWLRALMNDLVGISLSNPTDNRLATLLDQLITWGSPSVKEAVLPLLPPGSKSALDSISEWEEEDIRRWEEGGY